MNSNFITRFESAQGCYGAKEALVVLWERGKVEELGADD